MAEAAEELVLQDKQEAVHLVMEVLELLQVLQAYQLLILAAEVAAHMVGQQQHQVDLAAVELVV